MAKTKEQDYLNAAIYERGDEGTLDDIEQEKPIKYKKKPLGYQENIIDKFFKKKKIVKAEKPKKEKKETSLGKTTKNSFNIFKKKKKEISFFNKL